MKFEEKVREYLFEHYNFNVALTDVERFWIG
jgi:hypothetical protein